MPLRRVGGGGGGGAVAAATASAGTSTVGGRAMRYYRLWIYTCNTALLAGALAFCGAAARTLLFDFRRTLIPSLTLYQPSFLYAYLALVTQGGALQLLGCLAALRLSEKLLNAYWLLLLVLLFGDVVLGAFWAFKFERICQELRPTLRIKFQQEYGTNQHMTDMWDRLQNEESCCGVTGPDEFNLSSSVVIINNNSNNTITTATTGTTTIPSSCCLEPAPTTQQLINNTIIKCIKTHINGCDERLLQYLRSTASLLAILGYCVLAFLKMCFLGILRYEIREMIQKIRILRAELEIPNNLNGAVPGTLRIIESNESERESLLTLRQDNTALLSSPPSQPSQLQQQQQQQTKNPNGNNNYEMREYRSHDNI